MWNPSSKSKPQHRGFPVHLWHCISCTTFNMHKEEIRATLWGHIHIYIRIEYVSSIKFLLPTIEFYVIGLQFNGTHCGSIYIYFLSLFYLCQTWEIMRQYYSQPSFCGICTCRRDIYFINFLSIAYIFHAMPHQIQINIADISVLSFRLWFPYIIIYISCTCTTMSLMLYVCM